MSAKKECPADHEMWISDEAEMDETQVLSSRLDNANRHFRRKASAVLVDKDAVLLLAQLYRKSNLKIDGFDVTNLGLPLAKLTAANFCEVGSKFIYITPAGQDFIESLINEGVPSVS